MSLSRPALGGGSSRPEAVKPVVWGRKGKRSGKRKRKFLITGAKNDAKSRRIREGPAPKRRKLMRSMPEARAAETVHSLELQAYRYAVKAVYSSAEPLAKEQQSSLMDFRRMLHITPEEQRSELLRVMMVIQKERMYKELFGC